MYYIIKSKIINTLCILMIASPFSDIKTITDYKQNDFSFTNQKFNFFNIQNQPYYNFLKNTEDYKKEQEEKIRIEEERKRKEQELLEQERLKTQQQYTNNKISRGGAVSKKEIAIEVTFYAGINNSVQGGTTDSFGKKLQLGVIAAPKEITMNSLLYIEGLNDYLNEKIGNYISINSNQLYVVRDRGGAIVYKNGYYKIDVYIPRKNGESDYLYEKRIMNLGKFKTKAFVYNQ